MTERGAAFDIPDKPKVHGVLATNRVGFTDFWIGVAETVKSLNMPVQTLQGCYPEQGWETCAATAIKAGADYILFMDYDTVFTAADAGELLRIMQSRPDIAALFACQASRHDDKILCDDTTLGYEGEITERTHGHLGLTLVRAAALKRCPQPWFMGIPGKSGGWDDPTRIDADIAFWRLLRMNGLQAAQANRVVVGHLDLSVLWPTNSGNRFQRFKDYRKQGKPGWAGFSAAAPDRVRISTDTTRPADGALLVDGKHLADAMLDELEDDSVERIDARMVLQRFTPNELINVVRAWMRKVRPGGEVRITVPDSLGLARQFAERGEGWAVRFNVSIMGEQDGRDPGNRSLFCEATLVGLAVECGLQGVERVAAPKEYPGALTVVGVRPVSSQLHSAKPTEGAPADADLAAV